MAELGHEVVGIDSDAAKVARLASAEAPFFEPELQELLERGVASGRLRFTTDLAEVASSVVHFVAVGTPELGTDRVTDLSALDRVFEDLVPHLEAGDIVVGKSTVPIGTAARLAPAVEAVGASLVWNPEFLREGYAVRDTFAPNRLVYGVREGDERSVRMLEEVYEGLDGVDIPRIVTDFATAELVKVSANSFLATKVSFINAMAEIAEATGADVVQLSQALGHDPRIGSLFLNAGVGFGGGCLPKDIRSFMAFADEVGTGQSLGFLREVEAVNERRRLRVVELAEDACGGSVRGRRVAVLGLAFKPDSDDVRDSPALRVAQELAARGAQVVATDPHAIETARAAAPELVYARTTAEALAGAELVVLVTEWRQYRGLDPLATAELVDRPSIVDGRNCLDRDGWRAAGWDYRAPGRPHLAAD